MRKIITITAAAIVALGTGCAQSQRQGSPANLLPISPERAGHYESRRGSWMSSDAKSEDLLYVSNADAEVTVYQYWRHKLVGVLTSFSQPKGICSDKNQNVYIADSAAQQILEYAHGATKPIAKFDDSPDSPYSCWVDPATDKLAVANYDGGSQAGNIAIWSNGTRTTYADSAVGGFQFCAYDNQGNLLATSGSVEYPYYTLFAWLPKSGTKLIDINIPGPYGSKWRYVQGLQWDGKYFVVDDNYLLNRESLIHGQAYYVGTTNVEVQDEFNIGPYAFYTPQGATEATQVLEGMLSEGLDEPEVAYWKYPAGGDKPIATITHGLDRPFGLAISLKL